MAITFGQIFGVSGERVRQIDVCSFEKVQKAVKSSVAAEGADIKLTQKTMVALPICRRDIGDYRPRLVAMNASSRILSPIAGAVRR